MIGQTVSHYEILEHVDSVEGGEIFTARDLEAERVVFLRRLETPENRDGVPHLLRLAVAASELGHPQIETVLDVGEEADGSLYLCTPYREGESLARKLERGKLAMDEAIRSTVAIVSGLAAAHDAGITHRALRPENILFSSSGVKVLGFGLADLAFPLSPPARAYLAPEQLRGDEVDVRADVWALGVLLYRAISGQLPLRSESDSNLELAPLTGIRTGMDEELWRVFRKTMAEHPDDRYSRVADLQDELQSLTALVTPPTVAVPRLPSDESLASEAEAPAPAEVSDHGEAGSLPRGYRLVHFEIEDKIGEGAMGVVYRARDLLLDRSVALKFLPTHLSGNASQEQRFMQEAKSASALDHPNICTIYGIDKTEDGQIFIAMAYYEGETLNRKIQRGQLPFSAIVEVGCQIAEGLAAAHERGIVHRDVKPANVMINPDGGVKLLDFGISKIASIQAEMTRTGMVLGTAAYMSPEQARGEEIDHRLDIWALGVILYEMTAGQRPFSGHGLNLLYAVVERDPMPLRELRPDVPPELEEIIDKALAKDPEDRYPTVRVLLEDLRSMLGGTQSLDLKTSWTAPSEPPPRRRWRQSAALAAGAALTALVVLALWRDFVPARETGAPARILAQQPAAMLADLQLDAGPAPAEWMARAVSEILAHELQQDGRERWPRAPGSTDLSLAAARKGAEFLVTGSCAVSGSENGRRIDVELQLLRPQSGVGVVSQVRDSATDAQLLPLAARLAAELRKQVGIEAATASHREPDALTDPEARQLRDKAVERLRLLDSPSAKELLEKALEMAPDEPSLHAMLAEALFDLGRDESARQRTESMMEAARGLPLEQRVDYLALQFFYHRQWEKAAALLRSLRLASSPGPAGETEAADLDRQLRFAAVLIQIGEAEEALALLESAPEALATIGGVRSQILESEALGWLTRHDEQLTVARQAVARSRELDAPLLLARALRIQGEALWRLRELEEGKTVIGEASAIYAREGHRKGQADAARLNGILLYSSGDLVGAKASYDTAARLYGALGNQRAEARSLSNKALVLEQQGDLDASIEVNRRAIELYRESGDSLAELITLGNVVNPLMARARLEEAEQALTQALELSRAAGRFEAWILTRYSTFLILAGQLTEASRRLDQAEEILKKTDDPQSEVQLQSDRAQISFLRGDLDDAAQLFEKAAELLEGSDNRNDSAAVQREQGRVLLRRGELAEAAERLSRAKEIQGRDRIGSARTDLVHAELLLESGQLDLAVAMTREALAELEATQHLLLQSLAREILARSFLERGDFDTARAEIAAAAALLRGIDTPVFRLPIEITTYRVLAADGQTEEAAQGLQSLLAEATAGGFGEWELEIRLALSQIELAQGRESAGRSRIEAVAQEAELKGFGLLARKANRALR